jgi:hypothetical protein
LFKVLGTLELDKEAYDALDDPSLVTCGGYHGVDPREVTISRNSDEEPTNNWTVEEIISVLSP